VRTALSPDTPVAMRVQRSSVSPWHRLDTRREGVRSQTHPTASTITARRVDVLMRRAGRRAVAIALGFCLFGLTAGPVQAMVMFTHETTPRQRRPLHRPATRRERRHGHRSRGRLHRREPCRPRCHGRGSPWVHEPFTRQGPRGPKRHRGCDGPDGEREPPGPRSARPGRPSSAGRRDDDSSPVARHGHPAPGVAGTTWL
jgi:hypothetical protein